MVGAGVNVVNAARALGNRRADKIHPAAVEGTRALTAAISMENPYCSCKA